MRINQQSMPNILLKQCLVQTIFIKFYRYELRIMKQCLTKQCKCIIYKPILTTVFLHDILCTQTEEKIP